MLPFAAFGIVAGYLLAAAVAPGWIEFALGLVSILFAAHRLWTESRGAPQLSSAPAWFGAVCGVVAGFTSQIAHSGAPPFQMYVLPKRLARDTLIGTSAIFFAAVNWMKVPAYAALGQFTAANLLAAAALLPVALLSTWAGAWLVRRVSGPVFYRLVYAFLLLVGARLVWEGVTHLVVTVPSGLLP